MSDDKHHDVHELTSRRSGWPLLRAAISIERRALLASTFGAAVWVGFGICVPLVLGWTVQRGIVEADTKAVWTGGLAILVLGVGEAVCDAFRHTNEMAASERTRARLRVAVGRASLARRPSDAEADGLSSGQIVARGTSDADSVVGVVEAAGYSIAFLLAIPVILALLVVIDVVLASIVVVTVVVSVLATWRLSATWEHRAEAAQEALGNTIATAQQSIEGFKVIVGVGGQQATLADYAARSAQARDKAIHASRLWIRFAPLLSATAGAATVTAIVVGGLRVIDGSVELGAVVSALGLALFLGTPVEATGAGIVGLRGALASAGRLAALIDPSMLGPIPAGDAGRRAIPPPATVAVRNLGFAYPGAGNGFRLEGLGFEAVAGQLVVITGAVGSGKSTVAALLGGERSPDEGSIEIDGRTVTEMTEQERHAAVLCVPQQPFLLAESIAENVRLGVPDASDAELALALEAADADEFVTALPDGASTVLADRGTSLSGGQRQRLALARALLAQPSLLVLDDALSGLEHNRQVTVLTSVRGSLPHAIVVVITINPAIRDAADVVVDLPAPAWHTAATDAASNGEAST